MSWYRQYRPTSVAGLHLTQVRETLKSWLKSGAIPQVILLAGPKGTGKTSTARILAAILNDPANQAAVKKQYLERITSALPAQINSSSSGQPKTKSKSSETDKALPFYDPDLNSELVQRIFKGSALVVHELDAASNRGIDEVRSLKERAALPPAEGLVSVFILDEVHMLTTEAFNALLKLLEEPPSHTLFVLATTELHKVPATIISRSSVLNFTRASIDELTTAIASILEKEHITAQKTVLEQIAQAADGSFRDAVKLTEQMAQGQNSLELASVEASLGGAWRSVLYELLLAVLNKEEQTVVAKMAQLRALAVDERSVVKALFELLHQALVSGMSSTKVSSPGASASGGSASSASSSTPDLLSILPAELRSRLSSKVAHFFLQELLKAPNLTTGPIPFLGLEVVLLDLVFRSQAKNTAAPKATSDAPQGGSSPKKAPLNQGEPLSQKAHSTQKTDARADSALTPSLAQPATQPEIDQEPRVHEEPSPNFKSDNLQLPPTLNTQAVLSKWEDFVRAVAERNSSVGAILSSARLSQGQQGEAQLEVFYQFHKDQLLHPKFSQLLYQSAQQVLGQAIEFDIQVVSPVADQVGVAINQVITTDPFATLPTTAAPTVVPAQVTQTFQKSPNDSFEADEGLSSLAAELLV